MIGLMTVVINKHPRTKRAGLTKTMACICGLIACECVTLGKHVEGCKYKRALGCPVAIECGHGYDVCPVCDPCTCAQLKNENTSGDGI